MTIPSDSLHLLHSPSSKLEAERHNCHSPV